MSTVGSDNFYKRKEKVINAVKTNLHFREYLSVLEEMLTEERDDYENMTASEFARGRISMLKSLIDDLKGKK